MRGKTSLLAVFTLIGCLLLSACGDTATPVATSVPAGAASPTTQSATTQAAGVATAAATTQAAPGTSTKGVTIQLSRFFGDCDNTTKGVTDLSKATSECEAIQILTNKFNAENPDGIKVERLGGAVWDSYYDALNAAFAAGTPPDVAVMHESNMPDYSSRGLLKPLDEDIKTVGIDPADWTAPTKGGVTYNNQYYGVPFDAHATLWHINVDLFKQAGLVDASGNPILPKSRAEFMDQAQKIKAATGKLYFATDASQYPVSVRYFLTLVWQQGGDIISKDGKSANLNTPEAKEALDFMLEAYKKGYSDPNQNFDASEKAFLRGDAAVFQNGTWVVDQYNRQVKFTYKAADFPTLYKTPAVWANSHMWVIPKQKDPSKYAADMKFIAFLYDHEADWAIGTGHLPARLSVLSSDKLIKAPQRSNYTETAKNAHFVPAIVNWGATEAILKEELESTWLNNKSPDQALSEATSRISQKLGH